MGSPVSGSVVEIPEWRSDTDLQPCHRRSRCSFSVRFFIRDKPIGNYDGAVTEETESPIVVTVMAPEMFDPVFMVTVVLFIDFEIPI